MHESSGERLDIDLKALDFLRVVAARGGIAAASNEVGLSASALSRQIQGIEARLGFKVFDRTTRVCELTEAGSVLLRETQAVPHILRSALRKVRESDDDEIRVGISTGLSLAHVSGIFHAHESSGKHGKLVVSQLSGDDVFRAVSRGQIDLGVATYSEGLPIEAEVCHRIDDVFVAIAKRGVKLPCDGVAAFRKWSVNQEWLLPNSVSQSRWLIDQWALKNRFLLPAKTELENYDLMGQLVAMGMGVALVPRRSVGQMIQRKQLTVLALPNDLKRELVVVRSRGGIDDIRSAFVDSILFR